MNLWDEMWEIGSNDWSANAIVEAPASTPQNHRPFYASADALDEGLYARCIGSGLSSSIATHDARRNLDSRRTRTVQRIRQKHANNLDKGHRLHERLPYNCYNLPIVSTFSGPKGTSTTCHRGVPLGNVGSSVIVPSVVHILHASSRLRFSAGSVRCFLFCQRS